MKPYKAHSLKGAERRVRQLVKLQAETSNLLDRYAKDRKLLAKLAAKGPAFFNPLEAMGAEHIRDVILLDMGMNPDGSFVEKK